jgi:hypothetical protein
MNFLNNPELKKYWWIEFSSKRYFAFFALFSLIFFIIYSNQEGYESQFYASVVIYFLLTVLWGSYLSANSVMNEILDNTWDFLRLSELSTWQLTFGKIFGSNIFIWSISAPIFCLVFISAWLDSDFIYALKYSSLILMISILSHSVGIYCSLVIINMNISDMRKLQHLPAVIIAFSTAAICYSSYVSGFMDNNISYIKWHTYQISEHIFGLVTIPFWIFWSIIGANMLFRKQMQMPNKPWIWSVFSFFLIAYLSGFIENITRGTFRDLHAYLYFMIPLSLCYLLLLIEPSNILTYRRLFALIKAKNLPQLLEKTPRFFISILIMLISWLYLIVSYQEYDRVYITPAMMILYLIRDYFILNYFCVNQKFKSPVKSSLTVLFVIYFLAPMFAGIFNSDLFSVLLVPAYSLFPESAINIYNTYWMGFTSIILQVVIAIYFFIQSWKSNVTKSV